MAKSKAERTDASKAAKPKGDMPPGPTAQPMSTAVSPVAPVPPASAVESETSGLASVSGSSNVPDASSASGKADGGAQTGASQSESPQEDDHATAPFAGVRDQLGSGGSDSSSSASSSSTSAFVPELVEAEEPQFDVGLHVEYFDPHFSTRRKTPEPRYVLPEPPDLRPKT